jgi:hypothetical protein
VTVHAIDRRIFVFGLGTSPIWLPSLGGCNRPPETPLAHLYGKEWVHKSYEMYGEKYVALQTGAEASAQGAYRVLAQKGVTALDALQSRDVPFFVRADTEGEGFRLERKIPKRLTFRAGMSDAERDAATKEWERAREFIHTDYEEIRRLNWALTTLMGQVRHVRATIENGTIEQYQLVRQLDALSQGEKPPFELPYQVSVKDYESVLVLLLERLEDDHKRLARLEGDLVTVGLTVRATDAGSASLADNIHKVLLAVIQDSEESSPRAAAFPQESDEREKLLAGGRALYQKIKASEEYIAWEKAERAKAWEQVGAFLQVFDAMTGLKTSAIFKQIVAVFTGNADYLSYIKTALGILPFGGNLTKTVNEALDYTAKARKAIDTAKKYAGKAEDAYATVKKIQNGEALKGVDAQVASAVKDAGFLNFGSNFATQKLDKQIAFFKDKDEVAKVKSMIGETKLMSAALPTIPQTPSKGDDSDE